jgi:hypothetical protein
MCATCPAHHTLCGETYKLCTLVVAWATCGSWIQLCTPLVYITDVNSQKIHTNFILSSEPKIPSIHKSWRFICFCICKDGKITETEKDIRRTAFWNSKEQK